MANIEFAANLSEVVRNLPPETLASFEGLITILKAVGIAFLIYVSYLVIMAIVNIRRMRILGRIERRMNCLEEKMDSVIKSQKVSKTTGSRTKRRKKK